MHALPYLKWSTTRRACFITPGKREKDCFCTTPDPGKGSVLAEVSGSIRLVQGQKVRGAECLT